MKFCGSSKLNRLYVIFLVALTTSGCSSDSSTNGGAADGKKTVKVVVEFPDGDPSVPPEQGGPGFSGEGWETAEVEPMGDSRAIPGGRIRCHIREWPGNLRMAGTGYNTWLNYTVRDLCYESLLGLHPNTLEHIPGLATHWQISEDKTRFAFRLNPRAHWSDGKPIVADDVVASWKLRMDKTLLDPSAQLVYGKLHEPIAKSKYIVEVTAKTKNWRNFLYFGGMSIFPAHEIGSITGKEYLDKYNYKYTAVSGPYVVHSHDIVIGKSITLSRRDDYRSNDDPAIRGLYNFKKIQFVVVADPQTAYEKACKGELDYFFIRKAEWWAKDLPKRSAVEKGWLLRQKIFNDAPNGVSGFALNTRKPPLDNVDLRRALQHLYDRETLIAKLAYNEYVPTDSYWPGGEYENADNEPIRYDPGKAVELLSKSGWSKRGPDGFLVKDGKRLSITLTWYSPLMEKYLTSFKESCANVGVEIDLDRSNPETMWKNMMERKFQMVAIGWGALVFPNPETSYHSRLADKNDNNNLTGFKSERVDELCDQYDLAFSQEERRKIIREVDAIVYKQQPYILSWYQPCQRVMYWNKFGMPDYGFRRTLEWEDAFATWWIDPEKQKALNAARKNKTTLPIPATETHFWDQQKDATASTAE